MCYPHSRSQVNEKSIIAAIKPDNKHCLRKISKQTTNRRVETSLNQSCSLHSSEWTWYPHSVSQVNEKTIIAANKESTIFSVNFCAHNKTTVPTKHMSIQQTSQQIFLERKIHSNWRCSDSDHKIIINFLINSNISIITNIVLRYYVYVYAWATQTQRWGGIIR